MATAPTKSFASGDSHYVVPMVLLCVLCLAAAFSAVLYAIAARADIDALSGRLSALESRHCACPPVDIKKNAEKITLPPHTLNGLPSAHRFRRSPLNQEFDNPELLNTEVEADISRQDRRRGSRRRGGVREDPGIRGGNRITGSTHSLALHFDGNTSKYSLGHRHFEGNGLLRHPDGIFRDWKMKEWGNHLSRQHRLQENEGTLTIRESGIYFVYAQVYYYDTHDVNGFQVIVNESPVLQCTTMTHGAGHTKANTCFTGGMVELHTGDTLLIKDIEALRYSIFQPEKSFFGLFRVAHHSAGQREGP
ncbi:uncharacterized protein LOC124154301 isoform X2 [Ischnura elegans]|uniref:uncharacterized protein LOC124154301 isoform X2 n=1 Tax=Ischnura elegans TaxID=197161 RepID=UPI001ED86AA8|nr:uncharacterized protein LOC124154301 isoform X2 [Ischnura elegans]